jgi:hypothetical protein
MSFKIFNSIQQNLDRIYQFSNTFALYMKVNFIFIENLFYEIILTSNHLNYLAVF